MQTFCPYPDFKQTAKCLDYKRLGKQRVEARQIYNIITGQQKSKGWVNHPAVKMWEGFEDCLAIYYNTIRQEWIDRGFKNTMPMLYWKSDRMIIPNWLGNEVFHASHRSNLLRKNKEYYSQFGWTEKEDLPYYWPVE